MTDTAFTVHGVPITTTQRDAGLAAMVGRFLSHDVQRALHRAGVCYCAEVADRLIQSERKAGRIKFSAGSWERVA